MASMTGRCAHVAFDGGGTGYVETDTLVLVENKTWPPTTEHK